jgi:hypothetical protein
MSVVGQTFMEKDGIVAVEAEHFFKQTKDEIRSWKIINAETVPIKQDPDPAHFASASNKSYIEVLPDTRTNHDEKLIHGENFSNDPGKLAIVHYTIYFNNPGKYYVWVCAFSTGTEDNGIHVGLNGEWPESGQRMQWCDGKNRWTWASKQRTNEVHCGVEKLIFLEIPEKGNHVISFSMREDGFEFDKFVLSKEYVIPVGEGIPELPVKN